MKKAVKASIIVILVMLMLAILCIGAFFLIIEPDITVFGGARLDTSQLASYSRTVTITNESGKPITDALYGADRCYVLLDELPKHTAQAFIAIEDKRFYKHHGVDYKRLFSAAFSNLKSGAFSQGASTITQQLIKNTHLSLDKTIRRKLDEIRLARKLERVYTKEQILEGYLNILYFGAGIRGLGTACRVMFGRPASELTLAQSAALAAIINNPAKYSPYNNPENLAARKNLVLSQMLKQGYISREEHDQAVNEELVFAKERNDQYYCGLIKEAASALHCTEKELFASKCTIQTAYDGNIAAAAKKVLKNIDLDCCARILVLNNASGGIVCDETNMPGYKNPARSPASTIKPFVSYAPALEDGYYPLCLIDDAPTDFDGYRPKNYKEIYRGKISMRECLIRSSNIAAVKLTTEIGIDRCRTIAQRFGLKLSKDDNSPAIALGGLKNGVTLPELANAYRTIANGGMYSECGYVLSIEKDSHKLQRTTASSHAIGDDTAYLLTDMLKDCARSGTAKKLKTCGIIAAKTGTNGDANGNLDCYCIAYTPNHTIAVQLYSTDNKLENSVTGAYCANMIKQLFESGAINTTKEFAMPDTVSYYDIDNRTLKNDRPALATPDVPGRYRLRALFSKKHLPTNRQTSMIDYFDSYSWADISN